MPLLFIGIDHFDKNDKILIFIILFRNLVAVPIKKISTWRIIWFWVHLVYCKYCIVYSILVHRSVQVLSKGLKPLSDQRTSTGGLPGLWGPLANSEGFFRSHTHCLNPPPKKNNCKVYIQGSMQCQLIGTPLIKRETVDETTKSKKSNLFLKYK